MGLHTIEELKTRQAYPLSLKLALTKQRIRDWVDHFGIDGVALSFSGGKDSTVLLDIAREMYPNLKAVMVDTGIEYPELVKFVKSFDNVDILKPKMSFVEVLKRYGYPMISKEVSECVYGARRFLQGIQEDMHVEANKCVTGCDGCSKQADQYYYEKVTGTGKYQKKESIPSEESEYP